MEELSYMPAERQHFQELEKNAICLTDIQVVLSLSCDGLSAELRFI